MKALVCKVGGLGDTVSVLPLLAALISRRIDLTVICAPSVAPLVQAVAPVRVVSVDGQKLGGVGGLLHVPNLVQRVGPMDVALLSHDECTAIHVCAALVSRRRIGFSADIAKGEVFLNDSLSFDPARNIYDLMLDPARHFMGKDLPLRRPRLKLSTSGRAEEWLEERGIGDEHAFGVVHDGAAHPLQRWRGEFFHRAAAEATRATGIPWLRLSKDDGLDVSEVAAILSSAVGFLGNHSGLLHLAALVGTPYVAVAGPTAPAWDPPWTDVPGRILRSGMSCQPCGRLGRPARHCQHVPEGLQPPCLIAVSPNAVAEAISQVVPLGRGR